MSGQAAKLCKGNDWSSVKVLQEVTSSYLSSRPVELEFFSFFDYEHLSFVSSLLEAASSEEKLYAWRLKCRKEKLIAEELFSRHARSIECGAPSDLSENYKILESIYNQVHDMLSNPEYYSLPLERVVPDFPKCRPSPPPVDETGCCTIPGYYLG